MHRIFFAAVICFLSPVATRADVNTGGNLVVGGVALYETPANYQKYIKFLTVPASKHNNPAFRETNVQSIRALENPLRRQIYLAMAHNRERFQFTTLKKAQENFTMRVAAVSGMVRMGMKVSDGGLDFNYYRPGSVAAEADPSHWRRTSTFRFETLPNVRPSDAIDGLCRGRFRGECLGAIEIIILQAARKAVGPARFDAMHTNGLKVGDPKGRSNARHARSSRQVSAANMVPGDWVYMKNQDDYNTDLRPGVTAGPWQGENAIYMGRYDLSANRTPVFRTEAAPRYSGMGVYNVDEPGMRRALKKGYLELMRPPSTNRPHAISESNMRWTSVRRLATGD